MSIICQRLRPVMVVLFLAATGASYAGDAVSAANSAATWDTRQLAQKKHCFDCHDATAPRVGPPFRDVARRFGGMENSKQMLAHAIRTGTDNGSIIYHWGPSTMPPASVRVPVDDEEAQQLADYVLSFSSSGAKRP